MSRFILERYPSIPLPTPITYQQWIELNSALYSDIEAYKAHWISSLVSFDGHYSLCEIESPDGEVLREACQKTGILFKQVWQTEMGTKTLSEKCDRKESVFLVEFIYQTPITAEMLQSRQENNKYCFTAHDVQKRFTWLSSDGKRSICCFQANNAEDIRTALRQVQRPFNKLCKAYLFYH